MRDSNRAIVFCSFGSAERRQQETGNQYQTRLHVQQSRDYNRLAFRYKLADDYKLSLHVLICIITEMSSYCKVLKFNGKTKETCCVAGKIKILVEPPKSIKNFASGFTADSKHLSTIKKYNPSK
ncbi:unnamed protein product [Onchocerca flexuosa]|uniref:Uncharacterized protein n=1 Tax=Onchocerca flexuosa TaxID=387005 RepID=A0A183H023_9BILA|nr:unnamed protein product [Onchocerca flexuosa]